MKLKIFTSVINRPDFLDIQSKLFKKNLKCDYEFYAVIDCLDTNIVSEFINVCKNNKINYIIQDEKIVSEHASQLHSFSLQWIYNKLIKNDIDEDIVFFVDSDMFLLDEFDPILYMSDKEICSWKQYRPDKKINFDETKRVYYPHVAVLLFNMKKLKVFKDEFNFFWGNVEGQETDTGGNLYYLVHKNNIKINNIEVFVPQKIMDLDIPDHPYNFEIYELDNKVQFFHYRAGSNWYTLHGDIQKPNTNKEKTFQEITDRIFSE